MFLAGYAGCLYLRMFSLAHASPSPQIQGAYRDLRDSWTTLDAGEEERLIAERLELAVKAARAVANGKGGE